MNRRSTGDWRSEWVAPGSISLLTHAAQSHWRWSEDIEVTHLYLSTAAVADVAAQAYDRHVRDVELFDVLRTDDPVLSGIAAALARESRDGGLGGRLYVDSLKNQACVHMLRRYANVRFPRAGLLRRALRRPMPPVNPICRRTSRPEHIARGYGRRGAAQHLPFHPQIPHRIRLPAARLCHAPAHRACQAPTGAP